MVPVFRINASRLANRNAAPGRLATVGLLAFGAMAVSACGPVSSSSAPTTVKSAISTTTTPSTTLPVLLSASEASWQLRNPLSRMVLLPAGGNSLAILGGLTAADTSASGIFSLNLANGALTATGVLPAAVHDAAGVVLGSNYLVIGGGSVSTVATVESAPLAGGSGKVLSSLPQPRSDCTAVVADGSVVIVGGYNGSTADPAVLETTDGTSFRQVSTLKVPVRYSALAAAGSSVYVFGGLTVGGSNPGQPSSAVQRIDLSTGVTSVVGSLPLPLEGAMTFVLNGHVYVAGGDTGTGNSLSSSSAVWAYDGGSAFSRAATLPVAVSNAGAAVVGGTAWIVGGEHDGKTTAAVQVLKG